MEQTAEYSARAKIANRFQFQNLPTDRNDTLWTEIRTQYELNLEELCALKNARCSQGILPTISLCTSTPYLNCSFLTLIVDFSFVTFIIYA